MTLSAKESSKTSTKASRRVPAQSRSREKYEKIIETARELIGNKGNDSVSMREISKHSGVALASIYQYFPDKNAILQSIMEELFDNVTETIEKALDDCSDLEGLIAAMEQCVDTFYLIFKKDPVLAILWAGMQANPKLIELDTQDSMKNAELISGKISKIIDVTEPQRVYDSTLLIVHTIGSTIRLALSLSEDQGNRLIDEFKELVALRLKSIS